MRNSSSNFKNSPSCLLLTPEVLQTPGGRVEEGGALDVAHEDPPLPGQNVVIIIIVIIKSIIIRIIHLLSEVPVVTAEKVAEEEECAPASR